MIRWILLVFFICQNSFAYLGYLRVSVINQNKDHSTVAILKTNNIEFARFSHATPEAVSVNLNDANLNPNGKTTPIQADYSNVGIGCEFDYKISFSYDKNIWIDLGVFHVPNGARPGALPIGLCGKDVCSNDLNIQKSIDRQRVTQRTLANKNTISNINDLRKSRQNQKANRVSEILKKPSLRPNLNGKVIDVNQYKAAYDKVEQLQSSQKLVAPDAYEQERLGINPQQVKDVLQKQFNNSTDPVSKYVFAYATLDLAINEYLSIMTHQSNMLADKSDPEQIALNSSGVELAQALKENFVRFDGVISVAKTAGRFAASELLDACELITQREYCLSSGRILTNNELALSAAGLFLSTNRTLLNTTLQKTSTATKALVDKVGLILKSGPVGKLVTKSKQSVSTLFEVLTKSKTLEKQIIQDRGASLIKGEIKYYGPLSQLSTNAGNDALHAVLISPRDPSKGYIANTFRSESYLAISLNEDVTLFRTYNSEAGKLGGYWSLTPPSGNLQVTLDLALDPVFGNPPTKWVKIKVPIGTTIYEGIVSEVYLKTKSGQSIGKILGGGSQVYIQNSERVIKPNWIVEEGKL